MKLSKKNPQILSGLDTNRVNLKITLPIDTNLKSSCPLLLYLNQTKAGVVFGKVTKAKNECSLVLSFDWSEVVNPSILKSLKNDDEITVDLVCIHDKTQTWSLGTLPRKSLENFIRPAITSSTDVLVETQRCQQQGSLPPPATLVSSDVTLVAFYLPQYHPIVENDIWWGQGFTEWTKVASAKPRFQGHEQPRLPSELGFYDLRVADVIAKQVTLAKEYGIGAFCFYYYWFGGRRLLERPIDLFLANPQIEMPFCICWANEPWTRRWDGLEEDMLIDQPHTPESDARFILDVIPILKDPRYLRVNGKPILLVYRAALLSLPVATTTLWRQLCIDAGVGEIELAAVESFGFESPEDYGFDSTVEFPPHGFDAPEVKIKPIKKKKPFEGKAWRYADAAAFYCSQPKPPWKRYRGVMPAWDNTPRRGRKGYAFTKSSPSRYSTWLGSALKETRAQFSEGERLVFINAWNEWGEGAILEPDQKNGRAYLEATRNTLLGLTDWKQQLSYLTENDSENDMLMRQNAAEIITAQMEAYQRTLEFMAKQSEGYLPKVAPENLVIVTDVWLPILEKDQKVNKVRGVIDQLGALNHPESAPHRRYKPIKIFGWLLVPEFIPTKAPSVHLMLIDQNDETQVFFSEIKKRLPRPDLYDAFKLKNIEETKFAGFEAILDCSNLPEGVYKLILLQEHEGEWSMSATPNILELI
jgi:hypothetical protein